MTPSRSAVSSDVALTLTALFWAAGALPSGKEGAVAQIAGESFFSPIRPIGVWFSHSSGAVLAGVGTCFIVDGNIARNWRWALAYLAMSVAGFELRRMLPRLASLGSTGTGLESWWRCTI